MISLLELPKGPSKKTIFYRRRMLWQEEEDTKKYHLVKWEDVCRHKDMSGFGVTDLDVLSICLLSKWIFKVENEQRVWQSLARKKYIGKSTSRSCKSKPG